jgi:hypothetical protein
MTSRKAETTFAARMLPAERQALAALLRRADAGYRQALAEALEPPPRELGLLVDV